jgi:hypothetical protein
LEPAVNFILNIVTHTPWWAFALLAVLVVFGLQALRPRKVPIWRLLIVPLVFIGWGVIGLFRPAASPFLVLDWLVAAAVGGAVARALVRDGGIRIQSAGVVVLAGSVLPLIRNLLIFSAKYGLTAAMAIAPARRADLVPWDAAVSGASAGYFLAWLTMFAMAYRRALRNDPVAQVS